jgi:hypothetical protein
MIGDVVEKIIFVVLEGFFMINTFSYKTLERLKPITKGNLKCVYLVYVTGNDVFLGACK